MAKKPKSPGIHPGPGWRIKKSVPLPNPDLVQKLKEFHTPDISDLMNKLYAMDPQIHNLANKETLCGPACTVRAFPGDNLMVHKSLDIVRPGSVIVIDGGRSNMRCVLGELVVMKAKHRGVKGFVIDGLVRDLPGIQAENMPVFARGVSPIGPLHRGPGEINFPIQCGGIVVNPGDIIIGDQNGVVVVPQEIAADLLVRLKTKEEKLAKYVADIRKGIFSNEWVDEVFETLKCEIIE